MTEDGDLGALAGRYETDNGRRGRHALVLLLLGLVVTPVSVILVLPAYGNSLVGDDVLPSVLLGCGGGLLLMGAWQGVLFLTRAGEAFELYEHGLVQVYGGKRRVARWDDVTGITDNGKDTALARALGGNVNVQVKLAQGRGVVITGLTEDAEHLALAVRRAVEDGARPTPA
ncbi:hypothetical protein [Prauserella muralis]|uniref:Uncharacterized protein n=1 Tax=Prauserella muralis TaxID=588067 RepID=A0A2V4B821_9PSEU|nr:hypothetical protein [Prauserella muralis]PXY31408.1 hypothetical protein BAY60_03205 [Prauserella muralis]TWE14263.1 hypothetical protein FHX69_6401 [Prauserella muralis]